MSAFQNLTQQLSRFGNFPDPLDIRTIYKPFIFSHLRIWNKRPVACCSATPRLTHKQSEGESWQVSRAERDWR